MRNAAYHTGDVKRVCENKLGIEFRSNGEFNGWFIFRGKKTARVTVPKGKKPLRKGTYKSMAMQLKLSIQQFDQLLDCPFKLPEYEAHLNSILPPSH